MPQSSYKICHKASCGALTHGRFCERHQVEHDQRIRKARGSTTQQGYGSRWNRYSVRYRKQHPLCVLCLSQAILTPSQVVDHIIPHRKNYDLTWDPDNHQALCKSCHDRKVDP